MDEIKEKIEVEIIKTEALIKSYESMSQPVAPDVSIGRISRMDAINNKSVIEMALRQAKEKHKKLHQVLSKIGSSDFGICMKCKKPIPIARILIRPESTLCVACAK